jgi:hypothetical protein
MADVSVRLAAMREELESEMVRLSAVDPNTVGIGFGKRVGDGTTIAVDRMERTVWSCCRRPPGASPARAAARAARGSRTKMVVRSSGRQGSRGTVPARTRSTSRSAMPSSSGSPLTSCR